MKIHVVVEGEQDRALFEKLLRPEVATNRAQVVNAGGRSSAASLARTLLTLKNAPVALIVDADATEDRQIAEERADLEALLRQVAPRGNWVVVQIVPELEALFFEDESALTSVVGLLSPSERAEAKTKPKQVLMEAFARHARGKSFAEQQLIKRIDADLLRRSAQLRPLMKFIEENAPSLEIHGD